MKKFLTLVVVTLVVYLIVLSQIGSFTSENDDTPNKSNDSTENNIVAENADSESDYIPSIKPVDVYGNFEEIGFSTEKDLGSNLGNFWTSTAERGGLDFRVEVSSNDVNRVQSIRATVINQNLNQSEAKQFLKYTASVLSLYGGSYESEINRWIDQNYNSSEAEEYLGNVYLRLLAPSNSVRIFLIDSNPNDGI